MHVGLDGGMELSSRATRQRLGLGLGWAWDGPGMGLSWAWAGPGLGWGRCDQAAH